MMSFSPCGGYLAVGTHTSEITIYSVHENYKINGMLKGHSSYINGIDWGIDSMNLRSNDGAYELLFWDIEKMVQDKSGMTSMKGVQWDSHSCKISYNTIGMFPPSEDYTHINSVAVSNSGNYLINGDDWGLVNIYNNPVPNDQ